MGTLKMEFPELYKHARRKNRTVKAALADDTWLADLAHGNTQPLWPEVIRLQRWLISKNINLNDQLRDTIKWNHEASGSFSTSSARLKFFVWLLLKNRLWCNDRLQRRGWPNEYFCQLCLRNLESSEHLFWKCPFSSSVWEKAAGGFGCNSLHPL